MNRGRTHVEPINIAQLLDPSTSFYTHKDGAWRLALVTTKRDPIEAGLIEDKHGKLWRKYKAGDVLHVHLSFVLESSIERRPSQ